MEDFFERSHRIIRGLTVERFKQRGHFGLPARVDGMVFHRRPALFKIFGFEVPDNQTVGAKEERVVLPSGLTQGIEHFRPNPRMTGLVFLDPVRADFEEKTGAFHLEFHL